MTLVQPNSIILKCTLKTFLYLGLSISCLLLHLLKFEGLSKDDWPEWEWEWETVQQSLGWTSPRCRRRRPTQCSGSSSAGSSPGHHQNHHHHHHHHHHYHHHNHGVFLDFFCCRYFTWFSRWSALALVVSTSFSHLLHRACREKAFNLQWRIMQDSKKCANHKNTHSLSWTFGSGSYLKKNLF